MKKTIIFLLLLALAFSVGIHLSFGYPIPGYLGGTGIATTTSANVGGVMQVSSSSPYLLWTIAPTSTLGISGGSGGSGGVVTSSLGIYTAGNLAFFINSSTISASSGLSIVSSTGFLQVGGNFNSSGTITQSGVAVLTTSTGLTVANFGSPNISQWTNNSGYQSVTTTISGAVGPTFTLNASSGIQISTSSPATLSFQNVGVTGLAATAPLSRDVATGSVTISCPTCLTTTPTIVSDFGTATGPAFTFVTSTASGVWNVSSSVGTVRFTLPSNVGFFTNDANYVTSTISIATTTASGVFNVTSSGNKSFTLTLPSNVGFFGNDKNYVTSTGANPTATVGLTVTNGTANTFLRSDAAPALSQGITPTWTNTHTFNLGALFNAAGGVTSTLQISALPYQAATSSLVLLGASIIQGGNVSGTFLGANPTSTFNGDFVNFQVNSSTKFLVNSSGSLTIATGTPAAGNALLTIAMTSPIFTVLSNGNVGIGTNNPTTGNLVVANSQGSAILDINSTNNSAILSLTASAGSGDQEISLQRNNAPFYIKDAYSNIVLSIDTTGAVTSNSKVGIGTASPYSRLNVSGLPDQTSTSSLVLLGSNFITGGNASGTFLAANPTSIFNGDFINFQVGSTTKYQLTGAGNEFLTGNLNVTGTATFASTLTQSGGLVSLASTTVTGQATATAITATNSLIVPVAASTSLTTATGSFAYDTTQNAYTGFGSNSTTTPVKGFFPQLIDLQKSISGDFIYNTTALATTTGALFSTKTTIPAGWLTAGKMWEVEACLISSSTASPPTQSAFIFLATSTTNTTGTALLNTTGINPTASTPHRQFCVTEQVIGTQAPATNAVIQYEYMTTDISPTTAWLASALSAVVVNDTTTIDTTLPLTMRWMMTFASSSPAGQEFDFKFLRAMQYN